MPSHPPPTRRSGLLVFLLFVLVGFAPYANTFHAPFLFDSVDRIAENPQIRMTRLTPAQVWASAFGGMSAQDRPVGNLSFALNYFLHGYWLPGYHFANIAIHVLAGFVFFLFSRDTLRLDSVGCDRRTSTAIALTAALIWLVHPVNTQSVTYIVQRLNSMGALFFVLAAWAYARGRRTPPGRRRIWLVASAGCWILALGCKQNTAVLPFLLFFYEWLFYQGLSWAWLRRHAAYALVVVCLFGLVAGIFLGTRPVSKATRQRDYQRAEFTVTERALTQFRVVTHYMGLFVLPHPSRLNVDHDFPLSRSLLDPPATLLAAVFIGCWLIGAAAVARRAPVVAFGIWWFFGNLIIESSVIPLALIFEHRTYLPYMGLVLVTVWTGWRYLPLRASGIVLAAVVIGVFSIWTFQRNTVWTDSVTFWADAVLKSPRKARPRYNLGQELLKVGRIEAAIQHLTRTLLIEPDHVKAHNSLGSAYARQGEYDRAVAAYRRAVAIDPTYVGAHYNLGRILAGQGDLAGAVAHYRSALQLQPDMAEALYRLAWLRATHPDPVIRDGREALGMADRLARITGPEDPLTLSLRAAALAEIGRFADAVDTAGKGLQLAERYGLDDLAASLRVHLQHYRTKRPFHH